MSGGSGSGGARGNMRKKRDMTYHYAGKVHVRGLLRRVWRPRYLALGDDGYLRYHEAVPPSLQRDSRSQLRPSANTSPKTILAVLDGARVIDPYSVVDRHVALPQGVYGFVFRGRPVELYATDAGGEHSGGSLILPSEARGGHSAGNQPVSTAGNHNASSLKHSKKAAVVNLVFPKGTARRKTAQKLAKQAINPDVLCGGFGGPGGRCDVGGGGGNLSRSSSSSSLAGYDQAVVTEEEEVEGPDDPENYWQSSHEWGKDSHESHDTMGSFQEVDRDRVRRDLGHDDGSRNDPRNRPSQSTVRVQVQASSIQSREYLCAASTAEEAESWVVALRWAAEHRRRIRYGGPVAAGGVPTGRTGERGGDDVMRRGASTALNHSSNDAGAAHPVPRAVPRAVPDATRKSAVPVPTTAPSVVLNADPPGRDAVGEDRTNADQDGGMDCNAERMQVTRPIDMNANGTIKKDRTGVHGQGGGDSKASLTSLLIEHDGWCKADEEKKKRRERAVDDVAWEESEAPGKELPELASAHEPSEDSSAPSDQRESSSSPPAFLKKHTIVVTKVCRFLLPPSVLVGCTVDDPCADRSGVSWLPLRFPLPGDDLTLEYDVKLLLLRNCAPGGDGGGGTAVVRPESVEERSVHKSAQDVLALVGALMAEFAPSSNSGGLEDDDEPPTPQRKCAQEPVPQINDTYSLLEDVRSSLLSFLPGNARSEQSVVKSDKSVLTVVKGAIVEVSSAISEALASVGIVDDAMRKLSKDCNVCSSRHFQEFLGLQRTHPPATTPGHRPTSIRVSEKADGEQIVREWLARTDHPSDATKAQLLLAVALRHKLCGTVLSLVAVWSTTRLACAPWSFLRGTRTVSFPFETYVTLIALSFFLGHINGISSRSRLGEDTFRNESVIGQRKPSLVSVAKKLDGGNFSEESIPMADDDHSTVADEEGSEPEGEVFITEPCALSSPLPLFPSNHGISCWSQPDHNIFMVRGRSYLQDRVKVKSAPSVFQCRGVDVWITDNAERNISRHPAVLGGKLDQEDTFVVNFLLPFSNLVAYFTIPPIEEMPTNVADVWMKFIRGDQQYRDGKLKLLPVVVDGPWIVKKAVGPGTSPAMIGRDLPLQYFFSEPTETEKGVYEVDVLVTASRIARGILNVVKGHTKSLTIAFAFIIEASQQAQLPETVLCAFQMHSLHLEDCPNLPDCYPDG